MTFDKPDQSTSRRREALRYARRGWRVVPMHTTKNGICSCEQAEACERPGKHPRTKHGVKDATTDIEQLKEVGRPVAARQYRRRNRFAERYHRS